MGLEQSISCQFGNPRGSMGHAAGLIMAYRRSNVERIGWAVSMLGVRSGDTVLEIGYGPGIGIRLLSERAAEGIVYGLDHSSLMLEMATRRNRRAIESGRVVLYQAAVSGMPPFDRDLDRVLDVNTFQFWEEPAAVLRQLRSRMKPGGVLAAAHQPRSAGARRQDAVDAGLRIEASLASAGFMGIRSMLKDMKPLPTVCVLGENPG